MAVLLNDPNSSFFEYLNEQSGFDWQQIAGNLNAAVETLAEGEALI